MKEVRLKFFLAAFVVIALIGLTVLLQQADAGRLAGGFSGGSLRGYGGEVTGPRGSEIAEGPLGGVAAEGPRGGGIAEGPAGARVAVGPDGRAIARAGRVYEQIKEFLKEHVAIYKLPRVFEVMDALPRTPTGKLLRRTLR